MPYDYLSLLTWIFAIVFFIAAVTFFWTYYEKRRIGQLCFGILGIMICGAMVFVALWSYDKYKIQNEGIEIKKYLESDCNLDTIFMDYYKKKAKEGIKYEFRMELQNNIPQSYISINEIDEFMSTRYIVYYHLSNIEMLDDNVLDEQNMEG